ncbi:sigma factor-like helix-turn-helix DNA-binding protein [Streptomyces albogriseolus]|uniref:sigma factor-like helix-turn-helix DNA-binding protein n=1 Tax=Streptomyces albogriseolus TaxID=1887 RepID=UPI0036CFD3B1
MSEEEVRRVSDALDAIEQIADLEQRVRAKSQVMAAQAERNKEWSRERDELIRRLHDEEDLSYRQIAARLGVKLSTVQAVFRGYKGSGTTRPKKAEAQDG